MRAKRQSEHRQAVTRDRQLLAGQRPGWAADQRASLHLGLLCHFERIVDFDSQVPYGTFQLAVAEQ